MEVNVQTVLKGKHWTLRDQALNGKGNDPVYVNMAKGVTFIKLRFDERQLFSGGDATVQVAGWGRLREIAKEQLGVDILSPGEAGHFVLAFGLKSDVDGNWNIFDGRGQEKSHYFADSESGVLRYSFGLGHPAKVIRRKDGRKRAEVFQLIFRQAKDKSCNPVGEPELWLKRTNLLNRTKPEAAKTEGGADTNDSGADVPEDKPLTASLAEAFTVRERERLEEGGLLKSKAGSCKSRKDRELSEASE